MATAAKLMKYERSTQERLEYYVDFCRRNPMFQCGKNNPREPKMMQKYWEELAAGMNSLRGPTRTSEKWKETLANWKNQLRTRARKIKMEQRTTGGGPNSIKKLSKFEERALSTFGSDAVDGNAAIATAGMQRQVSRTNIIVQSNSSNSVSFQESALCSPLILVPTSHTVSAPPSPLTDSSLTTSDNFPAPPSPLTDSSLTTSDNFSAPPSPLPVSPNFSAPPSPLPASSLTTSPNFSASTSTASSSSSSRKRKFSSEDMFSIFLNKIEKREEREAELLVALKGINESLAEILKQRNQ